MAPLSHALSGVILDHESYGSHLNSLAETIDEELERENLRHAGESLCEIWNSVTIDGHEVKATFVEPGVASTTDSPEIDHIWFAKHIRSSQYLLQIVKCDVRTCCSVLRSSLKTILPDGFLPAPANAKYGAHGAETAEVGDKNGKFLPLFTQLATKLREPEKNIFSSVST